MRNMKIGKANKGFTLIELMIVVAIIGILAAIAIPKFADLIRKSNEGATKGNVGSIRSALQIYYSEMEGIYPNTPDALTISAKYLSTIPKAKTPNYHGDSAAFRLASTPNDAGGWNYNNIASDTNFGTLFTNCTHTDSKSGVWTSY